MLSFQQWSYVYQMALCRSFWLFCNVNGDPYELNLHMGHHNSLAIRCAFSECDYCNFQ